MWFELMVIHTSKIKIEFIAAMIDENAVTSAKYNVIRFNLI